MTERTDTPQDRREVKPEVEDIVDWLLDKSDFAEGPSLRSIRGAIVSAYERGLAARSEKAPHDRMDELMLRQPTDAPSSAIEPSLDKVRDWLEDWRHELPRQAIAEFDSIVGFK